MAAMSVTIRRVRLLRGANWCSVSPVVIASLAGPYEASTWPKVIEALDGFLPQGVRSTFPTAPPETLGAAAEVIAGEVCAWAGFPTEMLLGRDSRVRPDVAALSIELAPLADSAFDVAAGLLSAVHEGDTATWLVDAPERLLAFHKVADEYLPASRRFIARAAAARGLPWRVLSTAVNTLVVGEGRFARRFDGASTWRTSAMAMRSASNKRTGNRTLGRAGVPVARQVPVDGLPDVRQAAEQFGLPIVIKPSNGRKQRGVSFVFRPEQLESAYARSAETESNLLAESWLPGKEYRVLVIDGKVASAVENEQAYVVGDGRSSIEQLIALTNADTRRGPRALGFTQTHIPVDELAIDFLAYQGMSPADVPMEGHRVVVHPLPMMRFGGGFKREVGDTIHPETREMLERAAIVLELDVAGIDLRTPDISRSWREVGAGICEVNPQPSLTVHYNVVGTEKRDVAGVLLDQIYPEHMRIPMLHVIFMAEGDREASARKVADALAAAGRRVAFVEERRVDLAGYRPRNPARNWQDAQVYAIEDPTIDAAVHLTTARSIVDGGLGLMRVDLLLVEPSMKDSGTQERLAVLSARRAGARIVSMPSSDDALVRGVLGHLGLAPRPAATA